MKGLTIILLVILGTFQANACEDPVIFLNDVLTEIKPALINKNDELLEIALIKYINFNEMAECIAGKNIWNSTNKECQKSFIYELKNLMLQTYKRTVYYYMDDSIIFFKLKSSNQKLCYKKRIQITSVIKKNNKNVYITYRLVKSENSWLVFDILIEGISILKSLKTQYYDIIKNHGLKYTTEKIKILNNNDL